MSFNTACIACGSKGYQGFVSFECSNSNCKFYKTPPPVNVNANSSPPSGAALSVLEQKNIGLEFLRMLLDGEVVSGTRYKPTADNDAKIAGGAARDWYFDRLAKDVDIFVEFFEETYFEHAFPNIKLIDKVGAKNKKSGYYLLSFNVWDVKYKGVDIQIILTPPMTSIAMHVETFDFGINKIMMDRNGNYTFTKEFVEDEKNKTLTVNAATINPNTLKTLGKRTQKMKAKFPGWLVDIK